MFYKFLKTLQVNNLQIYLKEVLVQVFTFDILPNIISEHLFYRTPPGDCYC